MNNKIDVTSTILEKGIDTAKDFLDKLIMPTIEETGLLIRDQVTLWRFKNQVSMLNKTKIYCENNNINPKTISLKLLCPLLDYSGIEEDENLQDKWAILLSNMVDSEQNIENHVFPYILSQLSKNEFQILEKVFDDKQIRVLKLKNELQIYLTERPENEKLWNLEIEKLNFEIETLEKDSKYKNFTQVWELQKEKRKNEDAIRYSKYKENHFYRSIDKLEEVPIDILEQFEISNLIRLGLVKEVKEFYTNSQTLEIPNNTDERESHTRVDLNIDVETEIENILTELGELFISACKEKSKNSH